MSEPKRTPLHDFHAGHGARFVDFSGWDMPVQYRGILEEHRAVRRECGLFDVSHMGELVVRGPDAERFLNILVTNDVSKMYPGRALYSPLCYPEGGAVDDLLIYRRGPEDFLLCVNAGGTERDLNWIRERSGSFRVAIHDASAEYALLALQGPKAAAILQTLTGARLGLIRYYHFAEGTVAGRQCLISRTGYTGEDGFELYLASEDAPDLAAALLEAGSSLGLVLAGLGARDSLRLEAGYPLYGHELSPEISPLAAGLGWTVKWEKGVDFVGRKSLERERQLGSRRRVRFFRTGDRRIIRSGSPVQTEDGQEAGPVLSGTLSPMLNEAIGTVLISDADAAAPLHAEVRGTQIGLTLIKPPFVPLPKH